MWGGMFLPAERSMCVESAPHSSHALGFGTPRGMQTESEAMAIRDDTIINPEDLENSLQDMNALERARRMKAKKGKALEPEHSNLFVGNLHKDATEYELCKAFSPYGVVTACRVFAGNGRTCALVKMENVDQAAQVVMAWRSSEWTVKFAEADMGSKKAAGPKANKSRELKKIPCDNLYVKGLPPGITEAELRSTFSKAGKVLEMKIMRHSDHKEDCAALIRMGSLEDAKNAIDLLHGTSPTVPPLSLSYYGKDARNRDNLYVKGLPLEFTKDQLEEIFKTFGVVRRCRILMPPPKAQDAAALVQMASVEQAARAMKALDGRPPPGSHEMQIHFAEKEVHHAERLSNNIYVKGLPLALPTLNCALSSQSSARLSD